MSENQMNDGNEKNNNQLQEQSNAEEVNQKENAVTKSAQGENQKEDNKQSVISENDMGFLNDVDITLSIEIGRAKIKIRDLLSLSKDSIVDLNKNAGEPVDIYANGKLISKGNIITANGKYCVRLMSITKNHGQEVEAD